MKTIRDGQIDSYRSVLSPDGKLLYDAVTGDRVASFDGHSEGAAFSPNSNMLAVGTNYAGTSRPMRSCGTAAKTNF